MDGGGHLQTKLLYFLWINKHGGNAKNAGNFVLMGAWQP